MTNDKGPPEHNHEHGPNDPVNPYTVVTIGVENGAVIGNGRHVLAHCATAAASVIPPHATGAIIIMGHIETRPLMDALAHMYAHEPVPVH